MEGIGDNIRKLRKAKKLTQEELGSLSGLSTMSIRRYENNERTPNIDQIRKIAAPLGVYISELIGENWDKYSIEDIQKDFLNSTTISHKAAIENGGYKNILDEKSLINEYRKLNRQGKQKAYDYVSDLSEQPKYLAVAKPLADVQSFPSVVQEPEADYLKVNAAQTRTDRAVTQEDLEHDEDLIQEYFRNKEKSDL